MIGSFFNTRLRLFLSAAFFAMFVVNLCVGKYRLWSGSGTSAPLDGTPEFLILLAAVALAAFAALAEERRSRAAQNDDD